MNTLLCFGDSNTWGAVPMSTHDEVLRFGPGQRWPGLLRAHLRVNWQVLEEGLCGRTLARDDPVEGADRNALRYLQPCLQSHQPLDAVIYMLGTNDLKARFGATAQDIAQGVHSLIDVTRQNAAKGGPAPRILLVCPPPILEVGCLADLFAGGAEKSSTLAAQFQSVALMRGVEFMDAASHISVSDLDGIHLDAVAHAALAAALADYFR